MEDDSVQSRQIFPWVLLAAILVIPFIAWAQSRNWRMSNITALAIFPLLGLWAWSIMWTHYIYGTVRILKPQIQKDTLYSRVTELLVFGLILLHPGLLAWKQWSMRGLLPPESLYSYVDTSLKLFVFFGSLSLLLFLSFDILQKLRKKTWVSKHWHWVSLSQAVAMTLVFIHSMALGRIIDSSWFEYYWVLLGALLLPCFGLILRTDWAARNQSNT